MKTLFTHAKLIFPDGIRDDLLLTMENGVISEISQKHHYAGVDETVDVAGRYLSPGFIDVHTHGAGGYDFMDGTEDAIKGACMAHLRHGTTSIVPTTLTCLNEELFEFFQTLSLIHISEPTRP